MIGNIFGRRIRSGALATLAGASVIALLAGCTVTDTGDSDAPGARESITIGLLAPVNSLDPGYVDSVYSGLSVVSSVYSALTYVDANDGVVPDVASSWEQSAPDTWRFHLRGDVRYTDGTPLTAETVAWNINRVRSPANALRGRSYVGNVTDAVAVDSTTVDVVTKGPDAELPRTLSFLYLLDPVWAQSHNPKTEAMGSGPYEIVSFNPQGDTVLAANPGYYGAPAQIPNATFRVFAGSTARNNAILAGEVDLANSLSPSDLGVLAGTNSITTGAIESSRVDQLRFNTDDPTFADVRVRQALNYAIDKEAITESVFGGSTKASQGQWFSEIYPQGYQDDVEPYPFDPDKARKLLAAAGHPDGFDTVFEYVPGKAVNDLVIQTIAAQLQDVGVRAKLVPITSEQNAEKLTVTRNVSPLGYVQQASQVNSTVQFLTFYLSDTVWNYWYNPEYDAIVAKIRSAHDSEEQEPLIRQAVKLVRDQAPVAFLWAEPQIYAINKNLAWTPRSEDWVRPYEVSNK